MKLIAINTAFPSEIQYQGKRLSTGIFKRPITGKCYVSKENLEGDSQADLTKHGGEHKAVYAFSADHYAYWCQILKKPEMSPGAFGENLTISGFDESQLHIGDQLVIGQCILEITQPRIPCYKLGIAVENNDMPRLFIAHFATGAYMRVVQEGFIEAGDAVIVTRRSPFAISVQSLFRASFDKAYPESQRVIETAQHIPELSSEWRKKLSPKK